MKEKINNIFRKVTIGLFILLVAILALAKCSSSGDSKPTTTTKVEESKPKEEKLWQPKEVAEYNYIYRSEGDENPDGSNIIINIDKVAIRDNNIVVTSYAPSTSTIRYAAQKYLAVRVRDKSGNNLSSTLKDISVVPTKDDGTEIVISGIDTTKAKWIELMPYKTMNNNFITFELK